MKTAREWVEEWDGGAVYYGDDSLLEVFTRAISSAKAEERERCARVARSFVDDHWIGSDGIDLNDRYLSDLVAAIRQLAKETP